MTVTLKLATSLDGRIATASGESQWITGPAAREQVHRLRADHHAVVIGIETALADDPELTVRLPGYKGRQPVRVVLDTGQRLTPACKLVQTARDIPTIVVAMGPPDPMLTEAGVQVLTLPPISETRPDLRLVVQTLGAQGLINLFVEGGGQVAGSFLRCGLVDALEWFRAPIILGLEGRPAIGSLAVAALSDAPHFRRVEVSQLGDDLWERYALVAKEGG